MKGYKPTQEKAFPMNTSASVVLQEEFWQIVNDLDLGEDRSKAIQTVMRFVIKNKNNDKFKKEIKELK